MPATAIRWNYHGARVAELQRLQRGSRRPAFDRRMIGGLLLRLAHEENPLLAVGLRVALLGDVRGRERIMRACGVNLRAIDHSD